MERTTLKLVFMAIAVVALCSTLGDARNMPKEEVNCIGGCPPGQPHCDCSPVSPPIASTDDTKVMPEEEVNCFGASPPGTQLPPCMRPPPTPPMNCIGGCPPDQPHCDCSPVSPPKN